MPWTSIHQRLKSSNHDRIAQWSERDAVNVWAFGISRVRISLLSSITVLEDRAHQEENQPADLAPFDGYLIQEFAVSYDKPHITGCRIVANPLALGARNREFESHHPDTWWMWQKGYALVCGTSISGIDTRHSPYKEEVMYDFITLG